MKQPSKLQDAIEVLLNDLHEGMESEVISIKDQVQQIKTLLADAIGSLHEAFENIDSQSTKQMKLLDQKNELMADNYAEVNSVNVELKLQLGSAIRVLQFEDIVSQSLGHTDLHLDRMDGFISRLSAGISDLHQKNGMNLDEYADELGKLHREIMSYRYELRLEQNNPVSQKNMDEGDVELF